MQSVYIGRAIDRQEKMGSPDACEDPTALVEGARQVPLSEED
jgi:hypothetical protein